ADRDLHEVKVPAQSKDPYPTCTPSDIPRHSHHAVGRPHKSDFFRKLSGIARVARALLPACRRPYRSHGDSAKSTVETGAGAPSLAFFAKGGIPRSRPAWDFIGRVATSDFFRTVFRDCSCGAGTPARVSVAISLPWRCRQVHCRDGACPVSAAWSAFDGSPPRDKSKPRPLAQSAKRPGHPR